MDLFFSYAIVFLIAGCVYRLFCENRYIGLKGLFLLLKRNFIRYVIPYSVLFFVNFIFQIAVELFRTPEKGKDIALMEQIRKYIVRGLIYSYDTDLPNCAPLWFLTCLFVTYIFFRILIFHKNRYYAIVCLVIYSIVLWAVIFVEKKTGIDELPWHIDVGILASVL